MADELALPSKTVNQFVPSLRVVIREDWQVDVPLTAQDNLLLSQVRVADMRKEFDTQYTRLKGKLKPNEFKAMVDTFAKLEDAGRFAYAPVLNEIEGGERAGHAAAQLAKAMAEGAVTAGIKAGVAATKSDKMKQILELGKSVKKKEVIIEATPAVAEEVA